MYICGYFLFWFLLFTAAVKLQTQSPSHQEDFSCGPEFFSPLTNVCVLRFLQNVFHSLGQRKLVFLTLAQTERAE